MCDSVCLFYLLTYGHRTNERTNEYWVTQDTDGNPSEAGDKREGE